MCTQGSAARVESGGGRLIAPQALLARILELVPQPLWVVDHPGCIAFANPAACNALGYADPAELRGKPSHQTVHYKRLDGTPYPEAECPGSRTASKCSAAT